MGRSKCEPSFGQIGGGEVHGDAAGRHREAHGGEGGADPFAGLGDRLVGKAHEIEGGQARDDGALDLDEAGLDALECHRVGACDHCRSLRKLPRGLGRSACEMVNALPGGARCGEV